MTYPRGTVDDTIRGSVASGYETVERTFRDFFIKRWDTGSAVSVYLMGVPVAFTQGGFGCFAGDVDGWRCTILAGSRCWARRSSVSGTNDGTSRLKRAVDFATTGSTCWQRVGRSRMDAEPTMTHKL